MLLAPKEPPWRGPLLALGDPIYNQADRRWTVSAWQRVRNFATLWDTSGVKTAELARLVGSAKEIDFCSRSYRGSETPVVLLGPRATSAEFEASLARRPSVIHLATHIVPAPGDSQVGYIALSLRPDGAPEFYGFNDISALSLNPRLVVMAGCNSGGGVQLPGEGLWGLTRAWLRAGAHSVAATSWPVLDQHGELLQSFYRFLSEEPHLGRPEIALQRAQIEMINSEKWKARSDYWAAYFVVSRN
jgi:CHAT domain-containing protein